MEMDNHMSDKDESCYENAEAAFSDDEEDLNSKGEAGSRGGLVWQPKRTVTQEQPAYSLFILPYPFQLVLLTGLLGETQGCRALH
jgi:hypothetical protein